MALMTYEQLDRSIDADSDSEDELAEQAHLYRSEAGLCSDDESR
jgi:LAS seventeen-binding protein 5